MTTSQTPILDLLEAPPEMAGRTLAQSVTKWTVSLPVGFLLGLSMTGYFSHINAFLLLPFYYVCLLVHELGHLLAGKAVGMKAGGIVVGSFTVMRSGRRWHVQFKLRNIFAGGLAKLLPEMGECKRAAFAWMVAGGPIASLVFVGFWGAVEYRYGPGERWWINTLYWCAWYVVFLLLVPLSSGINQPDYVRLWMLFRKREQSESWMAILRLQGEEVGGAMPRDWKTELVQKVSAMDPGAKEYSYAQLLCFYHFTDLKKDEIAIEHLENALARCGRSGKVLRQILFLEAAEVGAWGRRNVTQARTWLARVGEMSKPYAMEEVEALIAIREGRFDDAQQLIAKVRNYVEGLGRSSGLAKFAMEKLAEYEQACQLRDVRMVELTQEA